MIEYNDRMIHSFSCKETEALFHCKISRKFKGIERVARRKLLQLHAAVNLLDLRIPPGNLLEALHGDRVGQHSIRINSQWRVCFIWKADGVCAVEIVDYH
jgi:proteic killer suppression protein